MKLALLVLSAAFAALLPSDPQAPSVPAGEAPSEFRTREAARIGAHLERVEQQLRARDVTRLAPAQREARLRNLEVLHDYRVRGVFPHNHEHPGEVVPSFIDAHGTRCAMAHLIEVSGGGALVRRVAESANHARVADLASDPELIAWLDREGLTLEEAARIQPEYGWDPSYNQPTLVEFDVISAVTVVMSTSAIVLNVASDDPYAKRRGKGLFALGTGLVTALIGVGGAVENESPGWSAVDLVFGTASLACGLVTLNRHDAPPARDPRVSLTPFVRSSPEGHTQLAVNARF